MKKIVIFSILLMGLFSACSLDEPGTTETKSDAGTLASGGYVALGNSLTAGFQSGALLDSRQQYSYPNLIAQQMGVSTFEQPTVSYPGIPNIMELQSYAPSVITAPGTGAPTNVSYGAPYNNLGIPGIIVADILNSPSTAESEAKGLSGSAAIDLVLRNPGFDNTSAYQQAKMLNPSFITLWIGNNDVLGFATSGGASPTAPVPTAFFDAFYNELADSLETIGANVAVANIPNVTDIPFFTTVGPIIAETIAPAIAGGQIHGLYYQKHGEAVGTGLTNLDGSDGVLVTLVGSPYASLLGTQTGAWYRSLAEGMGIPVSALLAGLAGVDTTQAFGFHPQNPWPDALILDVDEIATAGTAVDAYNGTISTIATAKGWALVDANAFFTGVTAAGGIYAGQGLVMKTAYIEGEMFSLDGVHPSSMGYGVAANLFIDAINAKFGTNIAQVMLRDLREVDTYLSKSVTLDKHALDNTLKTLGAK